MVVGPGTGPPASGHSSGQSSRSTWTFRHLHNINWDMEWQNPARQSSYSWRLLSYFPWDHQDGKFQQEMWHCRWNAQPSVAAPAGVCGDAWIIRKSCKVGWEVAGKYKNLYKNQNFFFFETSVNRLQGRTMSLWNNICSSFAENSLVSLFYQASVPSHLSILCLQEGCCIPWGWDHSRTGPRERTL